MALAELIEPNEIVYFLYGLAYFTMGTVLLTIIRRPSALPILKTLPWLAGFGIIHGIHEWVEMLGLFPAFKNIESTSYLFVVLSLGTLGVSGAFLYQFGVELAYKLTGKGGVYRLVPIASFIAWLVIAASEAKFGPLNLSIEGDVFARYLMYLPGATVSGAACYMQYRYFRDSSFKRVAIYLLILAILFWANAVFAGIFVPKADFFPASEINKEVFLKVVGIPVIVFRALMAVGILVFVIVSMRVFDEEELISRRKREREVRVVDELSSKLARSTELPAVMPEILQSLFALVPVGAGAICLRTPRTDILTLEAARGVSESFVEGLRRSPIKIGFGTVGEAASVRKPFYGKLSDNPEMASAVENLEQFEAYAVIPLIAKEACYGTLIFMTPAGRDFEAGDKRLLSTIGSQLGMTLENVQLEEQRHVAHILQQSLLSPKPSVECLDIGVAYRPAAAEMMIGGDFYDFIPLKNGRLAVVIGDVSGKGLKAASLTAAAKNTVRAFLSEELSPSRAFERANKILAQSVEPGQFVTVLAAIWSPDCELVYSSAGHPPMLICNGDCRYATAIQGTALGILEYARYSDSVEEISLMGYAILYTDGLTDVRRGHEFFGEDGVVAAINKYRGRPSQEVVEGVISEAVEFSDGALKDDLMIIVIRRVA